ncbi:hypothetical protein EV184_12135 [Sinorhizobium americanum]|uniref:Uncharacterized protein n=1 Tax=Sinorhizobium americanum TaxID=194963 RepID=A0A4R2BEK5_9HYPH|nr:hypothetical protein EV184_12135 [Sinorhizobium americanum]
MVLLGVPKTSRRLPERLPLFWPRLRPVEEHSGEHLPVGG